MQLRKVAEPELFDPEPEWRPGLHIATGRDGAAYLVIGTEIAVAINEIGTPFEAINHEERVNFENASWLNPKQARRLPLFEEWLDYLWPVSGLRPATADEVTAATTDLEAALNPFAWPADNRAARAMQTLWLIAGQLVQPTRTRAKEPA